MDQESHDHSLSENVFNFPFRLLHWSSASPCLCCRFLLWRHQNRKWHPQSRKWCLKAVVWTNVTTRRTNDFQNASRKGRRLMKNAWNASKITRETVLGEPAINFPNIQFLVWLNAKADIMICNKIAFIWIELFRFLIRKLQDLLSELIL